MQAQFGLCRGGIEAHADSKVKLCETAQTRPGLCRGGIEAHADSKVKLCETAQTRLDCAGMASRRMPTRK
jgi:hypothetical protein